MSEPNSGNCDRHCAYCLKFLPAGTAKVCGKCHRRAYCSRDCQKADWSQKQGSQGHKNWCDLGCGEEDIDWEVKPVEGKGLGIIAKRFIPAKLRIMVDAARQHDHPAINDLMPIGGTIQEKIKLNEMTGPDERPVLCLRMSRINHDCDSNASYCNDPARYVEILFAERDIQAGEEITLSYVFVKGISKESETPQLSKAILLFNWGITCKDDCVCCDESKRKVLQEIDVLDRRISTAARSGNSVEAMEMIRKQLGDLDTIRAGLTSQIRTLFYGFQVGIMRRSTLEEGKECMRRAYELTAAIFHPEDEQVLTFKYFVQKPSRFMTYLSNE